MKKGNRRALSRDDTLTAQGQVRVMLNKAGITTGPSHLKAARERIGIIVHGKKSPMERHGYSLMRWEDDGGSVLHLIEEGRAA